MLHEYGVPADLDVEEIVVAVFVGGRFGNVPVSWFVSVTFALGMTSPEGSRTVPRTSAVSNWANRQGVARKQASNVKTESRPMIHLARLTGNIRPEYTLCGKTVQWGRGSGGSVRTPECIHSRDWPFQPHRKHRTSGFVRANLKVLFCRCPRRTGRAGETPQHNWSQHTSRCQENRLKK